MENPTTTTSSSAAAAAAAATSSETIIYHTSAFLAKAISEPDLRNHLFAVLHGGGGKSHFVSRFSSSSVLLKPLGLALEAVEKAIASTTLSVQSSSLAVAEKLLLSCPNTPFSSFLLSLIYSLTHRPPKAAAALLSLFYLSPLAARSRVAPVLFQELFLVHLLPVLAWFEEQRTGILTNSDSIEGEDDDSASVVLPRTKVLSKMNGGQARELKELEGMYEDVLNDNCRVFADYFIEILRSDESSEGGGGIGSAAEGRMPPAVVLKELRRDSGGGDGMQGKASGEAGDFGAQFGRYNVMFSFSIISFHIFLFLFSLV